MGKFSLWKLGLVHCDWESQTKSRTGIGANNRLGNGIKAKFELGNAFYKPPPPLFQYPRTRKGSYKKECIDKVRVFNFSPFPTGVRIFALLSNCVINDWFKTESGRLFHFFFFKKCYDLHFWLFFCCDKVRKLRVQWFYIIIPFDIISIFYYSKIPYLFD